MRCWHPCSLTYRESTLRGNYVSYSVVDHYDEETEEEAQPLPKKAAAKKPAARNPPAKTAAASAKAKRKAALSKANAEGPKGGLLDAFTGPPPAAAQAQPETVEESSKQPPVPAATPAALSPEKASIPC